MQQVGLQTGGEDDGEKTEGWSFLSSSRVDFVCFNSCSAIQESSSAEYPFHQIRYMHADGAPQWWRIFSILYSFSPSIKSGGGAGKLEPWIEFS